MTTTAEFVTKEAPFVALSKSLIIKNTAICVIIKIYTPIALTLYSQV